jgi:putative ABC transport system permease protein
MSRKFFQFFFRNIERNKTSFFINLIGLSTGLACTLLIYLWVNDEMHFDKFHKKDSQLFLVMQNSKLTNSITTSEMTPGLLSETLVEEMPEVEYSASVSYAGMPILSFKDINIKAKCIYSSKDFFNIFSFNLIEGNASQVLADQNSIVISEKLALELFNTTKNVIGNSIELGHNKSFLVTGVFSNVPPNSSLQFDFVLSYEELRANRTSSFFNWLNSNFYTYIILKKGTNSKQFNSKIAGLIKLKCGESYRSLFIKPYSEKYLYGTYENGKQAGGRIEYVKLFSLIAIFILVIACINFMNLSTAKASKRSKEVGIKKVVGASRKKLIIQYIGESIVLSIIALIIAVNLVLLFLPQFNDITGKKLQFNFDLSIILSVLGITILTGLISGSYPALYLSGFNAATVLKGKFPSSIGELIIRKGLVIFQFVLSIILITYVLVVYKQIEFIETKKLGYDKDNIIYLDCEGKVAENRDAFLSEIKNIPGVVNASAAGSSIIGSHSTTSDISWEGKKLEDINDFETQWVDYDYIEMLGIEMKEGRTFSKIFGSDSSKIIFNEAAIKLMDIKDPIGKGVTQWGENKQIIGITKDFHFESLYTKVNPLFFMLAPTGWPMKVMIKINNGTEKETINELRKFYEKYNPGYVFQYKFLDDDYQAQYTGEKRVSILSSYFAGLAILISCLGLFGLAAFTAERRRKEIGIRKVFGSSRLNVVYLVTSEFAKLVVISILIALPISFLITRQWLNSFAFRIDLEWRFFLIAGLSAMLIAWLTIGTQAIKTANINPTECLKDE